MREKRNNSVGPQVRVKARGTPKKLYSALTIASLTSGLSVSTQFFAHEFDYSSALGGNLNHFYAPWKIIEWWSHYNFQYYGQLNKAASLGVVTTSVALMGIVMTQMILANSAKPNEFLHGSARWSNKEDIKQAGFFENDGVFVGAWLDKNGKHHYLRHYGPEHVLVYAPTRSGKGVGLIIPTLLSWTQSAVITDLKGELWALTAGWRKKYANNKVLRFEPADPINCVKWNPLEEIRLGTQYEVGDVQNLANLIVDPQGKGLNDHWSKTAFALLTGCILHLLYKCRDEGKVATLPALDFMLSDPNRPIQQLWLEMTNYPHVNGANHPTIGSSARDMIDRPEEEAGSVLSTAKSFLSLYRDPVVANNVSKSEFKVKDLMNRDEPVSLYIITQPNDKDRLKPLVRILVNMIVRLNADKINFEKSKPVKYGLHEKIIRKLTNRSTESYSSYQPKALYKHKLLMMLDEFPSLGKLSIMQESLAFLAGYGIKCYIICQDINQLKSREEGYGNDETITSNCHVQAAYPPNRIETAEHLSKLTGTTTITKENITTSGKRVSALLSNVSRTFTEVQRPLLTPDEAMRMPGPVKDDQGLIVEPGDMILYSAGRPAIYGQQPLYFKDEVFLARSSVEPPSKTDKFL